MKQHISANKFKLTSSSVRACVSKLSLPITKSPKSWAFMITMIFTEMFEDKSFIYSPNCHEVNNYQFSSSFGHFWLEMCVIFYHYNIPGSFRHFVGKKKVLWPRGTGSKRISIGLKPLVNFIADHRHVDKKMSSSSVVPVVLWGSTPPSHCISCIITTYDQKTVVTGSTDGQLGIWDLRFADDGEIKVSPRGPGVYTGRDLGAYVFPKKSQVVTFLN